MPHRVITTGDEHNPGRAVWAVPRPHELLRRMSHVAQHLVHPEGDGLTMSDDFHQVTLESRTEMVKDTVTGVVGVSCQNCATALSRCDTPTPVETRHSQSE